MAFLKRIDGTIIAENDEPMNGLTRAQLAVENKHNLENADLQCIELRGEDMSRANMEGANLERACFDDANLEGANIQGTNCKRAHFVNANLDSVDLGGADFEMTNFTGASFWNTDLSSGMWGNATLPYDIREQVEEIKERGW